MRSNGARHEADGIKVMAMMKMKRGRMDDEVEVTHPIKAFLVGKHTLIVDSFKPKCSARSFHSALSLI